MSSTIKSTMFGKYFKHVLVLTFLAGIAYPLPQMKEAMNGAFAVNSAAAAVTAITVNASDASASMNGRSTLRLSYDRNRGESELTATIDVVVSGGEKGINVYKNNSYATFFDSNNGQVNGSIGIDASLTPLGKVTTSTDSKGLTMYSVPAGKKVIFRSLTKVHPQRMFSGTYYASMNFLYVNKGTGADTVEALKVQPNQTNKVTIVGEKSPYISSINPNPAVIGKITTINGERLEGGKVLLDGVSLVCDDMRTCVNYSIDGKFIDIELPSTLANGTQHVLEVNNPTTGLSNRFGFEVRNSIVTPVVQCPVGYICEPVPPTIPQIPDCPKGYTCSPTVIGSIYVSIDSSTPEASTILAGATDVTFAVVSLQASTTDITNLNGIHIASDSTDAGLKIKNIRVYDGSTIIGTISSLTYNGSYYYGWVNNSDIIIPAHSSRSFRIVADINPSVSGVVRLGIGGLNFDAPGAYTHGLPVYGSNIEILESAMPIITLVSKTSSVNDAGNVGTFNFNFKIEAQGGDIFFPRIINGYSYKVYRNGSVVATPSVIATIQSAANVTSRNNFEILEGETEQFTLTINVMKEAEQTSALYNVALGGIAWDTTDASVLMKALTSGLGSFVSNTVVLN
jgi:hypothetical protein